ncbi:MAG: DUF721 domain-containing protein [Alphaproteobacteria bacterium]|nr:DUF721 domain-containing protein [Alphaproteobacteria bacterium]
MAQLPQNLIQPLHRIAQQAVGKDWQLYSILLQNWREIVGADWADTLQPVKLAFPLQNQRSNGALTVALPRGLAMEAQYRQTQILSRINGFFGQETVTRLVFVHATTRKKILLTEAVATPEAQAAVAVATEQVADVELRHSLQAFGEVLAAQRSPK